MWDQDSLCGTESGIEIVDPKTVSAAELLDNDFAAYHYVFERMDRESNLNVKAQHLARLNRPPTYVNVARSTEIPHTLLMGPWDEEAVKFLFWLVIGGACIDSLTSTSGEVLFSKTYSGNYLANKGLGSYHWI